MARRSTAAAGRQRPYPSVPAALRHLAHWPRKSLGQHFLVDKRVLARIVTQSQLRGDEVVVEVGAGLGDLTQELALQARRVVAVEVDDALCRHLRQRFGEDGRVQVIQGDILALSPEGLLHRAGVLPCPYVVVGNLPYNIATAVVRHFLEAALKPQRLVVMLQREVAQNLVAGPGRMSFLSVSVQLYSQPRLLFMVPPQAFYPPPKVRSAVVRLDVRPELAVAVDDPQGFLRLVQAGFAAPRKQIRNSLALGLAIDAMTVAALLEAAGVEPTRRPQTLSLEEWAALYRACESTVPHEALP